MFSEMTDDRILRRVRVRRRESGRNGGYRPTPLAPTATTLSVVSLYSREGREPGPEPSTMPGAIQRLDRELSETHRRHLSAVTIASLVAEVKAEREELTYSI